MDWGGVIVEDLNKCANTMILYENRVRKLYLDDEAAFMVSELLERNRARVVKSSFIYGHKKKFL